ncbi:MAG: hypothetical protein FWB88_10585 [Defluviitaleaceae bacterium]|nr:hypothetical protein [Defluviitaleaceae bacterium]MCL2239972.1 hypothetical protein [Defluviitaleaceae bacterium]
MAGKLFNNPDFIKELKQDFERVDTIAKAQNKEPIEILDAELQHTLDEIRQIFHENALEVKKRRLGIISDILPNFDEKYSKKEAFKNNLGFGETTEAA